MDVLAIIGLVLAAVLLLIVLLLLLPLRLTVDYDSLEGLRLKVKLWIFTLYKTKPGQEDEKEGAPKKQKPAPKSEKLTDTARDLVRLIKNLLASVGTLLRHCRVKRLRLSAVLAGDNAADVAMEYGVVCSILYPFIGYLKTIMKVDEKGMDIGVSCDFERETPELVFSATLSALLLFGGLTVMKVLIKQAEE